MNIVRRLSLTLVVCALVAAAAYGVGWSRDSADDDAATAADRGPRHGAPRSDDGTASPSATPDGTPGRTPTGTPDPEPGTPTTPDAAPETDEPSQEPADEPSQEPQEPRLQPGPALIAPGDEGAEVRELQARLRQIDWFNQDVTGSYGDVTRSAVEGFQAKREIPVTGEVDQRTMDRLLGMTSEPTAAELANQLGDNVPGALDPRCETGRVLCVDKSSRTLRWVVDGQVLKTVDVRFGSEELPTREGAFQVFSKSRDHVSSLYDTSMPFAMFFSGGQAVHYSPDFAATGYDGASHGCVNVRDLDAITWLFDQVQVGDSVIVYWS